MHRIYSPKYQTLDGNFSETLNCVNVLAKVSMVMNESSKVTLKFSKLGEQTIKIYSYLSNKLKTVHAQAKCSKVNKT